MTSEDKAITKKVTLKLNSNVMNEFEAASEHISTTINISIDSLISLALESAVEGLDRKKIINLFKSKMKGL